MGRNGSGKTTLLRTGLGVYRPDFGVVRYDDAICPSPRLWRLAAAGLFYLPDRGLLAPRRTLQEHLSLILDRFPEARVEGVFEDLGIPHLLASRPEEMSGGERRRAEIALAVARRPRCLLADEPLTEIEPRDRAAVCDTLRDMAASGCAILVTGHEVDDLLELADEIIWMVAGTTHSLGTPAAARVHDQFRREYLGPRG